MTIAAPAKAKAERRTQRGGRSPASKPKTAMTAVRLAAATPKTMQNEAMESDGRCHEAVTTATATPIGKTTVTSAATDLHRGAVTITRPTATVVATVA